MKQALGLIETKGLAAAVAAADKALKTANIILEGKEITEPGYVTIKFTGELNEIQLAVAAGAEAARDTGELISSIVIADPSNQLSILFEAKKTEVEYAPVKKNLIITEDVITPLPEIKEEAAYIGETAGLTINVSSDKSSSVKKQVSKPRARLKKPEAMPAPKVESDHSELHQKSNAEMDTITRLRMEALGKKYNHDADSDTIIIKETAAEDLNTLNVHQLRRLARNTPDFPIFGRKISKANRDELLKMFNGLGAA